MTPATVGLMVTSAINTLTLEDAVAFVEEVQADIGGILDALRDDLRAQERNRAP